MVERIWKKLELKGREDNMNIFSFFRGLLTQNVLPHSGVPLSHAKLCIDCDTVYDYRENPRCPSCASGECMLLLNAVKPLYTTKRPI